MNERQQQQQAAVIASGDPWAMAEFARFVPGADRAALQAAMIALEVRHEP